MAAGLELRIPVIAEVDLDGQTLVARRDIHLAEKVGDLQNPRPTELRFDGGAIANPARQPGGVGKAPPSTNHTSKDMQAIAVT